MKKTIITIVTIAAACIGLVTVDEISRKGKAIAVTNVKKKIEDERSDKDRAVLSDYKDAKANLEALQAIEDKKVDEKVNEYKSAINYISRKEEISNKATKKVEDFKVSIGYDELKKSYKKDYEDSLATWKTDNDFAGKIAAEKAKIDEAEKVSQNQKLMARFANDNSEYAKESAEKINEAIKEAKDKAVKEANDSIKAIEKEFKDFEKSAKKDFDDKLIALNNKVSAVRDEASKESASDLKALETDVSNKVAEIKANITANESAEYKKANEDFCYYDALVKNMQNHEQIKASDEISKLEDSDLVAAYLKHNKIGKFGALGLLSIPFAPVVYMVYKYSTFVLKVIGKME